MAHIWPMAAVAAGTAALVGSCYGLSVLMNPEPFAYSLEDLGELHPENTVGHHNRRLLVSARPDNEGWWLWRYRGLRAEEKRTRHARFGGVDRGYGGDAERDLNAVCGAAYRETGDGLDRVDGREMFLADVLRYCSREPETGALNVPPRTPEAEPIH